MAKETKTEKNRVLRIALNKAKRGNRKGTAKRAIKIIRDEIKKHTRSPTEKIRLSKGINEKVWEKGIHNLPRQIEIEILEEKENTRAFLKQGNEKDQFLAGREKAEKAKKKEETKKAEEEKKKESAEEKKAEEEEKEEQAKKLEEKRLKESMVEKADFK